MEMEVTLPPSAEQIRPIFITSPCNHAGAALIQRSVSMSTNGFCYGDNLFDEIMSQIDWAFGLIERHQNNKEREQQVLDDALNRKPSTWMPELAPPHDIYMASLLSVIYNLPHTAQHCVQENGRDIWMLARASVAASRMNDLLSIFPTSKGIFVHRNPLDIVRDTMRDAPGSNVTDICVMWNDMMSEYLTFQSDRLLKLCYEDAQTNPDAFATSIEEFSGVTGLQGNILDAGSEAELESSFELSPEVERQIKVQCEDMLAVFYPTLVP